MAYTMPLFVECTAAEAEGLEKAVNIRVDWDGNKSIYQVVNGKWTLFTPTFGYRTPPSLCVWQASNTSTYWKYAGQVPAH